MESSQTVLLTATVLQGGVSHSYALITLARIVYPFVPYNNTSLA